MAETGVSGIGANVSRLRHARKLTGEQLAYLAGNGLTRSVIANLENGRKSDLTVRQLLGIAYALEASPADLVFDLRDPYVSFAITDDDDQRVETQVWLARDWFGGQRNLKEIRPIANGVEIDIDPPGGTEWLIHYNLNRRAAAMFALDAHERRIAVLRKDPRNVDGEGVSLGNDVEKLRERIRDFRAELYEVDKTLRSYGVNLDRPIVHPAIPF